MSKWGMVTAQAAQSAQGGALGHCTFGARAERISVKKVEEQFESDVTYLRMKQLDTDDGNYFFDNCETPIEKKCRILNNDTVWTYGEHEPPIWMDNAFAGEFADNYIHDTSLEGGHIDEAVARLVPTLEKFLPRLSETVLKGFSDDSLATVTKVLQYMSAAGKVKYNLKRMNYDNFGDFILERIREVKKLAVGEMVLWPGGWTHEGGGHAIMYLVEKTGEDICSWITCNTGEGIGYHPMTKAFYPKQKRRLAIRIDNIPTNRIANEAFLFLLFKMQFVAHNDHDKDLYYNVAIPFLLGSTRQLSAAWNIDDEWGEWETPQKAGTCFYRCLLCSMKYLLRRHGLSKENQKRFFHAIRQAFLCQALEDLKRPEIMDHPLHHSHTKLLILAAKQTAYSAVKESNAGRIDSSVLQDVKTLCEEVEASISQKDVMPATHPPPLLRFDDEDCAPMSSKPLEDGLLSIFTNTYNGDTDGHKGDDDPSAEIFPVNYLANCPPREELSTPEAIASCLDDLHRSVEFTLNNPKRGESLYEVMSLIEIVFNEVLPCPQLSSTNPTLCPWQPEEFMTKSVRSGVMEDLMWCSQQYSAARDASPTNIVAEGVRIVTHARILCAFWALFRRPAVDFDETEMKIHAYLCKYPIFLPENAAGESFEEITANLPFVSAKVIAARAEICAELAAYTPTVGSAKSFLFSDIAPGGNELRKGYWMFETMAEINKMVPSRVKNDIPSTLPRKKGADGKLIKPSFDNKAFHWLFVDSPGYMKEVPDFYALRDMLQRYAAGIQNDLSVLLRARGSGVKRLMYEVEWKEEDKKGKVVIKPGGLDYTGSSKKHPVSLSKVEAYGKFQELKKVNKELTEEDVLFMKTLPNFNDTLSEEDSERIFSYLTAPYLRIPMLLDFFANGRVGYLFNKDLRMLLYHSLLTPGHWSADAGMPSGQEITEIPCSPSLIGSQNGILWNELSKGPSGCLESLLSLLNQGADQCVEDYKSGYVTVFLFMVELGVKIQRFLIDVIHRKEADGCDTESQVAYNKMLSHFLSIRCTSILDKFIEEAKAANDKVEIVKFYAFSALAVGNFNDPARQLNAAIVGKFIGACAFVKSWHVVGTDESDEDEENSDGNAGVTGGFSDDELFWLIRDSRGSIEAWYSTATTEEKCDMLERVVRIGTSNDKAVWCAVDKETDVISSFEDSILPISVNRQTAQIMFEKSGLEMVPEEVAMHPDFTLLFPGAVPHCSIQSRHTYRHVLYIPENQMQIENWRSAPRGTYFLNAPSDGSEGSGKGERVLETPHTYESIEKFDRSSIEKASFKSDVKRLFLRFDRQTSTCPTTAPWSAEYFDHVLINSVCEVTNPDGMKKKFDPPEDIKLFGGPGHACWKSEYCIQGHVAEVNMVVQLDPEERGECPKSWLWGFKAYVAPEKDMSVPIPFVYGGKRYTRSYQYQRGRLNPAFEDAKWVFDILDPILDHNFASSKDGKSKDRLKTIKENGSKWFFLFPETPLLPDSTHCILLALSGGKCGHEIHVSRALKTLDIFTVADHGRYCLSTLTYTNDGRFASHDLPMVAAESSALPLPHAVRYSAGMFLQMPFSMQSIVARDMSTEVTRIFIPPHFLEGRIPDVLLENFRFWKVEDTDGSSKLIGQKQISKRRLKNGSVVDFVDPFFDYELEIELGAETVVRRIEDERRATNKILLSIKSCEVDSRLTRLARLLVRFDTFSHTLLWMDESTSEFSLVEMPRLLCKFQPKGNRLYSLDQQGYFVSDVRNDNVLRYMKCLPHCILLENSCGNLSISCPNRPMIRPNIKACPFSSTLVNDWGNPNWLSACHARTFTYDLHVSGRFVLFPSVSATFYWAYCMLLGREYEAASLATNSCDTDMPLSTQQVSFLENFNGTFSDGHPDAIACRLKLQLALIYNKLPSFVLPIMRVGTDYLKYVQCKTHVSACSQLNIKEELQLLHFFLAQREKILADKQGSDGFLEQCEERIRLVNVIGSLESKSSIEKDEYNQEIHSDNHALTFVQSGKGNKWYATVYHGEDTNFGQPVASGSDCLDILGSIWDGAEEPTAIYHLAIMFLGKQSMFLKAENGDSSRLFAEMLCRLHSFKNKTFSDPQIYYGLPNLLRGIITKNMVDTIKDNGELQGIWERVLTGNLYKEGSPFEAMVDMLSDVVNEEPEIQPSKKDSLATNEAMILRADDCTSSSFTVSNYGNKHLKLEEVSFGQASIDESECESFQEQPLRHCDLDQYITVQPTDTSLAISEVLPFDLSGSEVVATDFGRSTMDRLSSDMKSYAEACNSKNKIVLNCISDTDISDYEEVFAAAVEKGEDPPGPACVESATSQLNSLIEKLKDCKSKDFHDVQKAMDFILERINSVSFEEGSVEEDELSRRYRFALERFAGLQPRIKWEDLVAVILSTNAKQDLLRANPYIAESELEITLRALTGIAFKTNRMSHANWALGSAFGVIGALKKKAPPKNLLKEVDSLVTVLSVSRHYIGEDGSFDPRFLVFEYLFGMVLRKSQVYLVNTFVDRAINGGKNAQGLESNSMVHQMIMGAGKTTVIGPLLALLLADGQSLVTQVVPDALLEMSRSVMWNRFAQVITKRVYTLSFGRGFPAKFETVNALYEKLIEARDHGGIVCTTPATIKSIVNRYVELLNTNHEFARRTELPSEPISKEKSALNRKELARFNHASQTKAAHALAQILKIWGDGVLLMDEVDMLLHPLRSELNFPVGQKYPLTPAPHRWSLPIHILDGVQYAANCLSTIDSRVAPTCLESLKQKVKEGVDSMCIQTVPHLVLIDQEFYKDHMKESLGQWTLIWLRSKHLLDKADGADTDQQNDDVVAYLHHGASCGASICDRLTAVLSKEAFQMINLGHDWLSSILPHVLSKIDRISFGLLKKQDLEMLGGDQPLSRQLCAVPFMGKDVPSGAAEFAQPDCLIGSTILAYAYEGLRIGDIKRILVQLKYAIQHEPGKLRCRPSYLLFERWVANACKLNNTDRSVPSLDILQPNEKKQVVAAHKMLFNLPETIYYYLQTYVFPKTMQNQNLKIGSSGQELGSDILFGRRLGFSGTPSNLLPLDIQPCHFETGSEGRVVHTLSVPSVTQESPLSIGLKEWNIKNFLDKVASGNPKYHALIDTGALITGYSNEQVARYLMNNGLPHMDGCVYLDENDCKMIYTRGAVKAVPMNECGISKEKRFTFYDQVHTTGMDIKQALSAVALLTLGKDMIFRDYAQGAYRMRGIGVGQTIHLYIIPEVKKIIRQTIPQASGSMVVDACAWLQINGIKQEKMQFMQLCTQNTATVGRKEALGQLIKLSLKDLETKTEAEDMLFSLKTDKVADSLEILRETVSFDIADGVPTSESFVESLNSIRLSHSKMIHSTAQSEMLAFVTSQAQSLVAGNPSESSSMEKSLGGEMTREKEREQEQEQQRQQQQQAQISYGNEKATVIPWKLTKLNDDYDGDENAPFYKLNTFTPRPEALKQEKKGEKTVTVQPVDPLKYPEEILLSSNYLEQNFSPTALIRIRNASMMLEWNPKDKDTTQYAALSLDEAQSLRRFLHSDSVQLDELPSMALHSLESNRRYDVSPNYDLDKSLMDIEASSTALQFWNNKMFFEAAEIKSLLQTLGAEAKENRKAMFNATLMSRRRDRSSWVGTPIAQVFELENDEELTKLLNFVATMSADLDRNGVSILNVCHDADIDGDGFLSQSELQSKLSELVPSAPVEMVNKLVVLCDKDGDNAIDYDEFSALFEAMVVHNVDGDKSNGRSIHEKMAELYENKQTKSAEDLEAEKKAAEERADRRQRQRENAKRIAKERAQLKAEEKKRNEENAAAQALKKKEAAILREEAAARLAEKNAEIAEAKRVARRAVAESSAENTEGGRYRRHGRYERKYEKKPEKKKRVRRRAGGKEDELRAAIAPVDQKHKVAVLRITVHQTASAFYDAIVDWISKVIESGVVTDKVGVEAVYEELVDHFIAACMAAGEDDFPDIFEYKIAGTPAEGRETIAQGAHGFYKAINYLLLDMGFESAEEANAAGQRLLEDFKKAAHDADDPEPFLDLFKAITGT